MHNHRGQSVFEYVVLLALVVAALVVMRVYMKRGIAGGLRQAADSVGEQYSPRHTTGNTNLVLHSNIVTHSVLVMDVPLDNVNKADVMVTSVNIFAENSNRTVNEQVDQFANEGFWE